MIVLLAEYQLLKLFRDFAFETQEVFSIFAEGTIIEVEFFPADI